MTLRTIPAKTAALTGLTALVLAGCAQTTPSTTSAPDAPADGPASSAAPTGGTDDAAGTTAEDQAADAGAETAEDQARPTHESGGPAPRLAITYDGGVMVVDAMSLEVIEEFPAEGFTRLNPAGDGRHLFLSEGDSFRLLDAGTWSEPHGNHDHSYTTTPVLTDLRVEGSHPGHAVAHAGHTALYFDGDGRVEILDTSALDATAGSIAVERTHEVADAHHGVAVVLEDGSFLETVGTSDERSSVQVLDADGEQIALTQECPGVHGEAVAADEVVVLGCEDGLVVYRDGDFSKISSPDPYGRIGNQAGSEQSPVVLGDYKVDPDADLERPERVSLTDTRTGELSLVDLGTSYSFRSLARGPQGEALVLGTDGQLHVIDPESGEITEEIDVVAEWSEPEEWQQPRPTLFVLGQFGYVTEPETSEVHIVDLDTMTVIDSATLPQVPNEISGVDGRLPKAAGGHDDHDHRDEGHEDHDHGDEGHEDHDRGDEGHDDHDHGDEDHDHDH